MKAYLDLLREIREKGVRKPTRAKLESTGENIDALSLFGRQIRFDLSEGFPMVTTKKVPFGAIAHEMIWFLRGSSNITYLLKNNVHIWDQWADEDGNLGPVYGVQWRKWPTFSVFEGVDQIANVILNIKKVIDDPTASVGRRLIVTAWNPNQINHMALPPCHTLFQFSVTGKKLSCQLYQRSADMFLGVPFNISSYALLIHLVAKHTGLQVGEFVHTFGDVHIYANHLDQVDTQLSRDPLPLPTLVLDDFIGSTDDDFLKNIKREHIRLIGYDFHPELRGEVAV